MALSYPLALPAAFAAAEVDIRAVSVVGVGVSPFSLAQQVYAHSGMGWEMDVRLPPLERDDAEEVVAFLLALNGREGTFLMGEPHYPGPRGTWNGGSPLVAGANQVGRTLRVDGLAAGLTAQDGDWFQLGTGSSSRLYKVVQGAIVGGSPAELDLEIWPAIVTAPADNAALDIASPEGLWRLATNERRWSIGVARIYGVQFAAVQAQ